MTESKRVYLKKPARREQILAAAMTIAIETGYGSLTRDGVAKAAGVSMGQVNHSFEKMSQLRNAVMRRAVKLELLPIIAQGLATSNKYALAVSDEVKMKALLTLIEE